MRQDQRRGSKQQRSESFPRAGSIRREQHHCHLWSVPRNETNILKHFVSCPQGWWPRNLFFSLKKIHVDLRFLISDKKNLYICSLHVGNPSSKTKAAPPLLLSTSRNNSRILSIWFSLFVSLAAECMPEYPIDRPDAEGKYIQFHYFCQFRVSTAQVR